MWSIVVVAFAAITGCTTETWHVLITLLWDVLAAIADVQLKFSNVRPLRCPTLPNGRQRASGTIASNPARSAWPCDVQRVLTS